MNHRELFTEEQLDYLVELFNIGAGNATTALNHLLLCEVSMKMPRVDVLPAPQALQALSALGDPAAPVVGLRMKMVGDLEGCLFFIVPDEQKKKLADLAERALLDPKRQDQDTDQVLEILQEIGNILAGVYLTALHDFCKLNVCHSVPALRVDMMQSLLDEAFATLAREQQIIILITNEFVVSADRVESFFLILPTEKATQTLVGSMKVAGRMYGYQAD